MLIRYGFNLAVALLAAVLLGLLSLLMGRVGGAPLPPRKPPKAAPAAPPVSVVGHWWLTWGDGSGPATFNPDGSFACWWSGAWWEGRWKLTGNALSVEEGQVSANGPTEFNCKWTATLVPGTRKGTLDCGGRFELGAPKVTD